MKITGLNHITINVTDLAASVNFYKIVLGLTENGFIDMGDHTLTYFDLPQNVRLELIDYADKGAKKDYKETDIGTYRLPPFFRILLCIRNLRNLNPITGVSDTCCFSCLVNDECLSTGGSQIDTH